MMNWYATLLRLAVPGLWLALLLLAVKALLRLKYVQDVQKEFYQLRYEESTRRCEQLRRELKQLRKEREAKEALETSSLAKTELEKGGMLP